MSTPIPNALVAVMIRFLPAANSSNMLALPTDLLWYALHPSCSANALTRGTELLYTTTLPLLCLCLRNCRSAMLFTISSTSFFFTPLPTCTTRYATFFLAVSARNNAP